MLKNSHEHTPPKSLITYVLKRTIESCVGWFSFICGLVHRGGEFDSCMPVVALGDGGFGVMLGVLGTGVLVGGVGVDVIAGGGVCGVSSSSEVRAGLPSPDSLINKSI